MSASDEVQKQLGLSCPDGGEFYVCEGAKVEFVGCCRSDPCANDGKCPTKDLRISSFSSDEYPRILAQSCDDNRRDEAWFTCSANKPPFLGCCASNPCANGSCPEGHLLPAMLSDIETNRRAFLGPKGSSTSSLPSSTSETSPTSSSQPGDTESSGLSTGAIAGIAVGGAAALIIVGVLLWLCRRRARKSNQGHTSGPEMASYHDNSMPNSPAPWGGARDSHMSAATTAIPHSYHSTPTSPDFPKTYAHYAHPHHQHPSMSPPPLSAQHPPSVYSQYADSDGTYHPGPMHSRHISQMSGISDHQNGNILHPVSEIDGVERGPIVELSGEDGGQHMYGKR